jgi:hypothetical protein
LLHRTHYICSQLRIIQLEREYYNAVTAAAKHDLACAGAANLFGYLGWLRGGELFKIEDQSERVILSCNGPQHGLPPHIGAVCADLLDETKADRTRVADCVVAYKSLSGLCLGDWVLRILQFAPQDALHLFSTANYPTWNSYIFRERFAFPLLSPRFIRGTVADGPESPEMPDTMNLNIH